MCGSVPVVSGGVSVLIILWPFRRFTGIQQNGGLARAADYGPYLMADGYCHAKDVRRDLVNITGYVNVTSQSEVARAMCALLCRWIMCLFRSLR
jgi:hypothetical protein